MAKFVRGLFYAIFAVFGGLSGYSFSQYTERFFAVGLPESALVANTIATILLGILLGVTVAPFASYVLIRIIDSLASTLQSIPVQEVLMGSVGLLFGLIIAFFVNLALQTVSFGAIPIIGVYLGPLTIITSTVFLGTLGAYFGSRVVFIHSVKHLLTTGMSSRIGQRLVLLDTSVIIDGRIVLLRESGFLDGVLMVPRFVLAELQLLADSEDVLKRNRGRRGLDLLNELRKSHDIEITDKNYKESGVDGKLIRMALDMRAYLCTTDYNLAKVAAVQGVEVLNVNQLTSALKPVMIAGEVLQMKVIREGKESGQGIGYLDDGTMVVIEDGRKYVGETVDVEVTSLVQTNAGRMYFSRCKGLTANANPKA